MSGYYLRTGGVDGSDDLDLPEAPSNTKTFTQWRLGSFDGDVAPGPPGGGSDVFTQNEVSVPGLMGSLSVNTWTVQGSGDLQAFQNDGEISGVTFINGTLTINTIVIQGNLNAGIGAFYSTNPFNPGDPDAQSAFAIINATNAPIATAEGTGSIENIENLGTNYLASEAPYTIADYFGAIVNAQTVATTGADHIVAQVIGGTLTIGEKFNDWASLLVSQAGTVIMNGSMDPAADTRSGPYNNTITVTDANSSLISNDATFTIGGGKASSGIKGSFSVLNGATAELNSDVVVGQHDLDVGTINVTGKQSTLTVNGDFDVGEAGEGNLVVSGTASLIVHGDVKEAVKAGSLHGSGSDLFNDAGVTAAIDGNWEIGVAGTRADTINGGANVTVSGDLTLGSKTGGQGTLNVAGENSTLTMTGGNAEVTIGEAGIGVLRVSQGALFDAGASDVTVGEEAGGGGGGDGGDNSNPAQNLLDINAASAVVGNLTIGGGGSGNLSMENGGDLEVLADLTLGDESGSKYTAEIQLSTLNVAGELVVGNEGGPGSGLPVANENNDDGTPALTGGNLLLNASRATASTVTMGAEAGSKGSLVADLSNLQVAGDMTIGKGGSASVLAQMSSSIIAGSITLGDDYGATGSMTIDQSMVAGNDLTVGNFGKGSVTVTDGGILITDGVATLGNQIVANIQSVSIKSSIWSISEDLQVAEAGVATLSVQAGGAVGAKNNIVIGDLSSASGIVTIKGTNTAATTTAPAPSVGMSGSLPFGKGLAFATGLPIGVPGTTVSQATTMRWGETLTVGGAGVGTLNVTNGGLVAPLTGGAGVVEIAAQAGSFGTIALSGASSLIASRLAIGGTSGSAGGNGVLSAGNGDTVRIASELRMWSGGVLDVSKGGAVTVGGGTPTKATVAVGTKGTLVGAACHHRRIERQGAGRCQRRQAGAQERQPDRERNGRDRQRRDARSVGRQVR